eukprot:gene6189-7414_t
MVIESWLWKRRPKGLRKKHWDHRYFKIVDDVIFYYKGENDTKPRNSIPLWSIVHVGKIVVPSENLRKDLIAYAQNGFSIQLADGTGFELLAKDSATLEIWLEALPSLVEKWTAEGARARTEAFENVNARRRSHSTLSAMSMASVESADSAEYVSLSQTKSTAPSLPESKYTSLTKEPDMKLHGLRISVSNHNSATRIQKDAEDPSLNPSESDISTSSDEDAAIPVDTSRKSNTAGIINNNSDSDVAPDFQTSNLTPENIEDEGSVAITGSSSQSIQGFLFKRGQAPRIVGVVHSDAWRRRWCVLASGMLQYFERTTDSVPKGRVSVSDILAVAPITESVK